MIFTDEEWEQIRKIVYRRKNHYNKFYIVKSDGKSKRMILAPDDELKALQLKLLNNYLYVHFVPSVFATGFVVERSIVDNALAHVGAKIIVNVDIKDFFPSITERMINLPVFHERIVRILERMKAVEIATSEGKMLHQISDDKRCKLTKDERALWTKRSNLLAKMVTYPYSWGSALPQGAPTSPALSNIICFEMDNVLSGVAKRNDAIYTRYADDLTFSSCINTRLNRIIPVIKSVIENYGFKANERKIHVNRNGGRMQVTGLVVNDKVSYGRGRWRIIRAILHNAKMNICNDKLLVPFDVNHFRGMAAYIHSFDEPKAAFMNQEIDKIVDGLKELKEK